MSSLHAATITPVDALEKPTYETDWKMVEVLADKLEYEHKAYSNHRYEKHVGPDIIKMPPSHAKEFQSKGLVQICRGGSLRCFQNSRVAGLSTLAKRVRGSERQPAGPENVWVRVRLTKFVSIIDGLEPHKLLDGDFYLPLWFIHQSVTSHWKVKTFLGVGRSKSRCRRWCRRPRRRKSESARRDGLMLYRRGTMSPPRTRARQRPR
ncbi:MAG: hypothetical protein WB586_13820 [Chthoniobacterales bacterium]